MQARTNEKDPRLVLALDGPEKQTKTYLERLSHARIEGPGATLAYLADDKTYVYPDVNVTSSDVLIFFFFFV